MLHLFRMLHVLAGALWVGTAVFIAFFLMPALRQAGPAAAPLMRYITVVRKLPVYMMSVTLITIVSGTWLALRAAGTMGMAWFEAGPGRVFGAGAVLGIAAAVVGMTVSAPSARRLGALAATAMQGGGPTSAQEADLGRLQQRVATSGTVVATLVLLAAAAMSMARYVP